MSSLYFSFYLLCIFFLSSSSAHSIHDDRKPLLEFKALVANDPHHSMANWNPANLLCNWTGIICTRRHQMRRVIAINLTGMDLQGTISPSLSNLSFLRSIDLSHNALHGNIPPQLGRLFRLRVLRLSYNQLDGSIPNHLASCHNLVKLILSFNNLSGDIPLELGSLPHLTTLLMGANDLTEYGLGEPMSTKGDVYSYGILLLEMVTRKGPTNDMFVGDLNLHKWVNFAFPDKVNEIIDNTLSSEVDGDASEENDVYKCLLSFLHVGLLCSKYSPAERPTMRDVVVVLETIKENLMGNTMVSRRPRRSISNLLGNTSVARNVATTTNGQSSSTF